MLFILLEINLNLKFNCLSHIQLNVLFIDRFYFFDFISAFFMGGVAGFGVTGGAHRFWTHRSYKANLPLRIILMICFSAAGQVRQSFSILLIYSSYEQ